MRALFEAIDLLDEDGHSLTIQRVRYVEKRTRRDGRSEEWEIRSDLVGDHGERFVQVSPHLFRSADTGRRYCLGTLFEGLAYQYT